MAACLAAAPGLASQQNPQPAQAVDRAAIISNMPSVRAIVRDTAQQDYRVSSIIMGIKHSTVRIARQGSR
jgi:hypothetical protein